MTIPPRIWRDQGIFPVALKQFAQSTADRHYEFMSDEELSTEHYPVCASRGAVRPHIDEFGGEELGKRIFGYVVRSDGHRLHTVSLAGESIELHEGDLYSLDPHDRHWTSCPSPDSQLIFVCTFLPLDDPRFDNAFKLVHDLQWETIKASVDAMRMGRKALTENAERYRGVEPIK